MSPQDTSLISTVPSSIAEQIILPQGHLDEESLFGAYEWLRNNAPLARVEVDGYDPVWLVAKHADIMEIERQPAIFSSGGGEVPDHNHNVIFFDKATDEFFKLLTGGSVRMLEGGVPNLDGDEHAAIRAMAGDWFRPANISKWDERIRVLARESIDQLLSGPQEIDLVKDFSIHYPLRVIMALFGIPREDEARMMHLTQEMFGVADPDEQRTDIDAASPEAIGRQWAATMKDFYAYFDALIAERRAHPQDDLATIISVAKQSNGEYFEDKYAYGWFIAIATAGHDTTSSTLASIIEQLALQPDLLARVQENPALIPDLINEGLRWASPVKHFVRRAETTYSLRGQEIKFGEKLMLLYQSANRDSDVFESPNTFDITRRPNRQIAFGYGPHMCVGQHLAKLELKVMLEELLPKLQKIELLSGRKVMQANFVGGPKNLPVRLELN
ncbi:cytochrome P450 [Arthrobacter sp. P2b]|uniref:cytochrome P450 n=1 Tax=Arthrobacter sp. P2b TaxID=1938741 RepID=UPI0009A59029|nr:cytochrome P450 [Arthrobacter sp. P2b]SLK10496.1 Cytochrome P450 [Arthrobacter sp. P2b]